MNALKPAGLHGRGAPAAVQCCNRRCIQRAHTPAAGSLSATSHTRLCGDRSLQLQLRKQSLRQCRSSGAISAAGAQQTDYRLDAPVTREQLQDPAHIGARTASSVNVQDRGGETGLDAYMQLPVEQYWTLNPDLIKQLGGNSFALQVPRIQLFNVWVEPNVHVSVDLVDGNSAVQIEAENWAIRGSDLIEKLNLNRRFSLAFTARLSWTPAASAAATGGSVQTANGNGAVVAPSGTGKVHGSLDLDVWSEVIGPFRFLPRGVLESTGNTVLTTLVSSLLPPFLKRLSADYERWATSPEYRAKRAQQATAGSGTSPYQ